MLEMKPGKFALAAISLAFVAQAFSQNDTARAPAPPPAAIPPSAYDANGTARFLAGLPPAPGSPLAPFTTDPVWQEHAKFFDTAWAELDKKQLSKIRAWDAAYNPAASASNAPVFYMFSGPDYLYVDAFFPNASTYVLCGIEPVGTMPDIGKIKTGTLGAELQDLQASLNSVLSFSFFITKEMKTELQDHEINGTLPIILIFIARSNNTIQDVSFVGLDSDGKVEPVDNPAKSHLIPGAKIMFTQPNAAQPQTLYYFDTDISDDGIKRTPGFLKFCESLAPGNSFVKSASYLMHEEYFSTVRNFLLKNSITIVEDDSGIPVSFFTPDQWAVRYFGAYPGPIDIFKKYMQPQLVESYQKSHPVPLDFGIGYRHYASQSTLILASHKLPQSPPAPTPAASHGVSEATSVPAVTPAPATTQEVPPISPPTPSDR